MFRRKKKIRKKNLKKKFEIIFDEWRSVLYAGVDDSLRILTSGAPQYMQDINE